MNVLKKMKNNPEGAEEPTVKKETNVEKNVFFRQLDQGDFWVLIDYEFREKAVNCLMEERQSGRKAWVWVDRAPSKLFIGRKYLLKHAEESILDPLI